MSQPDEKKPKQRRRGPAKPMSERQAEALDKLILDGLKKGVKALSGGEVVYITPSAAFLQVVNKRLKDLKENRNTTLSLVDQAALRMATYRPDTVAQLIKDDLPEESADPLPRRSAP